MALPNTDCESAAMSTVNVFVNNFLFPPFWAGVLASEIYKLLNKTDGPGILVGPNGLAIVNGLVAAGNYTYSVRSPKVVPKKEAPPAKKAKRSFEIEVSAKVTYYAALLKPPNDLPIRADDIRKFLSMIPVKLPLASEETYKMVSDPETVTMYRAKKARDLAKLCDTLLMKLASTHSALANESNASHVLCDLTGDFIECLNHNAPVAGKLHDLRYALDSANDATTMSPASKPLKALLRPDFELFINGCLILRWENKVASEDLPVAVHENTFKLKTWNNLFYGNLPYVVGGASTGLQFQWLKLYLGKKQKNFHEVISETFDLKISSGVAKFLHSTIRMHCLLQKLEKKLDTQVHVTLYEKKERDGGIVQSFPDRVHKDIIPTLKAERLTVILSMYAAIAASSYLIKLKSHNQKKKMTRLVLEPVGDPEARPLHLADLEGFTHDMLIALADLHKSHYTHRDIKWKNCIKVNSREEFQWVLIDLEEARPAGEKWDRRRLLGWDEGTLEDGPSGKIYTKGLDMYQLGKLILEWLKNEGSNAERDKMSSLGRKMQERTQAADILKEHLCKKSCICCCTFGTKM